MASADPSPPEVPQWLRTLPVAPEYHPTLAEFQDPIAYILKIEKEASCYGICKIVPPLPAPPRKNAVSNLNRSFVALTGAKDARRVPPTFATRQQQVGLCPRRPRPVQKPVWQSGEEYSLAQFEAKARRFERAQLKRCGRKATGGFSELEVEGLFWKAATDKPVVVEYANDIPGSGFSPRPRGGARKWREEDAGDVGDTAWNMRGVSREKGSLLKFMKEEIPGVTSPMVYIAMMFSWFAWHVEDHELHSLNYLHMGAGKTWYGVPRDARFAFEEVVRVHGYGGSVNPLATFALLGEKTTVMSPEVLVGVGIPCCRLVQNAGDFVITFPGSYHCGFSHGYNCGEASNIATPEWLKVAKEAAIRRASINVPPMVSHFQLLYDLALSLWSRAPVSGASEPRSSRLKDKFKGEGEIMIKELFVQSVTENNNLLDFLIDKGSSCVVLPQNRFGASFGSNSQSRAQTKMKSKPSLAFCNHEEAQEDSTESPLEEPLAGRCAPHGRGKSSSLKRNRPNVGSTDSCTLSDSQNKQHEKENTLHGEGLLEQGLLSCVTCGILSFACVAIIKPTEAAAIYLLCADPESFIDQTMGIGEYFRAKDDTNLRKEYAQTTTPGRPNNCEVLGDNLECTYYDQIETSNQTAVHTSASTGQKGPSALDLLASAYWDSSSDVDEEDDDYQEKLQSDEVGFKKNFSSLRSCNYGRGSATSSHLSGEPDSESGESGDSREISNNLREPGMAWDYSPGMYKEDAKLMNQKPPEQANDDHWVDDHVEHCQSDKEMERLEFESADPSASPDCCYKSKVMQTEHAATTDERWKPMGSLKDLGVSLMDVMPDKDSSRMHVFCLEHAVEVEGKLSQIGGAEVMLVCHPDYPRIEAQARSASKELGINYDWRDINFRSATEDDLKTIKSALEDEETIPMVSDWAVKMCINLYYSANLSKFPLYSQQIPYNPVIYKAYGRNLSGESPGKLKVFERRRGKKLAIAGRWCGKVWTSNQLHPYIPRKNEHEEHELVPEFEQEVDNVPELANADERPTEVLPDSPDVRTSMRKRKKTPEKSIAKRLRYTKEDSNESPEDSTGHSSGQAKRTLRSGRKSRTSTPWRNKSVKVPRLHMSSVDDDVEIGPRTRLRSRPLTNNLKAKKPTIDKQTVKKKGKQLASERSDDNDDLQDFPCNVEGCTMNFGTKQDLVLHKRNICPVKGCGKKFFSHKYLVQHRRVHTDDRPLKCPWKGCKMTFKWAWARTEHIRVHTGDRPYICMVGGCGQTFRFVSDFSRHKRKTGHVSKKGRR